MEYVEYEGKKFDARHGGPFDRGAADSYYGRPAKPHYFTGDTYNSIKILKYAMSEKAIREYYAGYDYNEDMGHKKEW